MIAAQGYLQQLAEQIRRLEALARTTLDGREADRLLLEAAAKRAKLNRLRHWRGDSIKFG